MNTINLEHMAKLLSKYPTSEPSVWFVTKLMFHSIQGHHYFVIGTRLISLKLNKKYRRSESAFYDLFYATDVDHAEVYNTRNEALRAVARNRRRGYGEEVTNPHEIEYRGRRLVIAEPQKSKLYKDSKGLWRRLEIKQ